MSATTISGDVTSTGWYRWSLAGALYVACCVLVFISFREAVTSLSALWWDSVEFGHGILVPPAMAYALWLDRARLLSLSPRLWMPGLAAIAACVFLWTVSHKIGVIVGEQTALMLMLPALSVVFLGPRMTRAMAFVFLFPFTASPLWAIVNPMLQEATAWATTSLVREFGIPMYREGNFLTIAYGRFHVAEMCSGLRYLLAGLSLSAMFAFLHIRSVGPAMLMMAAGFIIAVVGNWVRVTTIVVVGHMSEMQHPLINDHLVFGWVVFAVCMVPLILIGYRLAAMADSDVQHTSAASLRLAAEPVASGMKLAIATLASVTLIGIGPALDRSDDPLYIQQVSAAFDKRLEGFDIPGWRRVEHIESDSSPRLPGANRERVMAFEREGARVELYMGMLAEQRQGQEVVNDEQKSFNRDLYMVSPGHENNTQRGVENIHSVNEVLVIPRDAQDLSRRGQLVWSTYRVVGEYSDRPLEAKLLQLRELLGGTSVAFALAANVEVTASLEASRAVLRQFLSDAQSPLTSVLQSIESSF